MRSVLLPVLALSFASPALAATSEAQRDVQKMADRLNDRGTQTAMADTLSTMLGALMNIRLDGVAKALEPLNQGRKLDMLGKTVGDMVAKDDPHFEDRMHDGTRAAVGSMGALASALAVMIPQLEKAAKKMGNALPDSN